MNAHKSYGRIIGLMFKGGKESMDTNYRSLKKAIIFIVLASILAIKLPHINKSIAQILIPPIKIGNNSRIYLNGLLIIIPFYWSYKELIKSNIIKADKFVIGIIMILFIPIFFQKISMLKTPYYYFASGLGALEVTDSNYGFSFHNDVEKSVNLYADIKNYSNKKIRFKIAFILPEKLQSLNLPQEIILPREYTVVPEINKKIQETYDISDFKNLRFDDISKIDYYFDDYEIKIFNDNEKLIINQSRE
jgi:predicted nucleotide-binding protein (sugar kinase/HSP70/actin superfamily)